jgi:hypothetical protein
MRTVLSSLLGILLLTITTVSCTDGDFSENSFEADFCVVKGQGSWMFLLTDGGSLLYPTESLDTSISPGDRFVVTYVSLSKSEYSSDQQGYTVRVVNLQPVLVKDVNLSTDDVPVAANDLVWVVNSPFFGGGYLNFEFKYMYSDLSIKHGIYLMQDSIRNRSIYLRFTHEANGDAAISTASALASFPLSSISGMADADSLVIQSRGGSQSSPRTITYSIALADTLQ